jgi:hypothetical protein
MAAKAAPTLQQVRARATAAGPDRLLFDDRGSNLAVKQGKRGKFAGQGPCVEPPGGIEPPTFSLPSIHALTL